MNGRLQILLTIGVGAAGIALLMYASIRASARQYVKVHELAQSPATYDGKRIKLSGEVLDDTASFDEENLKLRFRVTDAAGEYDEKDGGSADRETGSAPGTSSVTVRYQGPKPDAFKEGGVVIVEGVFHQDGNWIETKTLQAKCPSRYKKKSGKAGSSSGENEKQRP